MLLRKNATLHSAVCAFCHIIAHIQATQLDGRTTSDIEYSTLTSNLENWMKPRLRH